eukprot:3729053-Rhodomonas_salina.1
MIVAVGTVAGMSQTNAALSVVLLSTVWGSLCSATTIPLRASPHPMLRSDRGPIGAAPGMLGQAQPPLYLRGGASELSPTTSWWSRTDSDQGAVKRGRLTFAHLGVAADEWNGALADRALRARAQQAAFSCSVSPNAVPSSTPFLPSPFSPSPLLPFSPIPSLLPAFC